MRALLGASLCACVLAVAAACLHPPAPLPAAAAGMVVPAASRAAQPIRCVPWPSRLPRCADVLSKEIRTEPGLLRYLHMLLALRGRPHLALLSTATRVRLQVRALPAGQLGGPASGGIKAPPAGC